MATEKLNIDKLRGYFKSGKGFETKDIVAFYKKNESGIKQTTVNWRVYSLIHMGLLNRIGRGKFVFGDGKIFSPEISPKMKAIYSKLKKEFPYLKMCIWNTSALNEFMVHQPGQFYVLIEVEKEATQSVFYFLKEAKYSVFIDPTSDILEKYSPSEKESIIIKPLVSEAPIQSIDGVQTATIEKILVDIFCDDVVFSAQQGAEMRTIFKEVFAKYTINQSKMLRYADRRRKKEPLSAFLKSVTNLWQQE